jgi:hypothetical protein
MSIPPVPTVRTLSDACESTSFFWGSSRTPQCAGGGRQPPVAGCCRVCPRRRAKRGSRSPLATRNLAPWTQVGSSTVKLLMPLASNGGRDHHVAVRTSSWTHWSVSLSLLVGRAGPVVGLLGPYGSDSGSLCTCSGRVAPLSVASPSRRGGRTLLSPAVSSLSGSLRPSPAPASSIVASLTPSRICTCVYGEWS